MEQDRAAGGRGRRSVDLGEGRFARASITLRLYRRTRRIRAYLRWSQNGDTEERYVCEVAHNSRRENLAEAWQRAWEKGMLVQEPLPPESKASSREVRAAMRANRGKNTGPELALRRLLHQRGLRYRVDARPLAGFARRADLVFPGAKLAIFVDGCFWHGCQEHYRPATKNAEFWNEKIATNRSRDVDTTERLLEAGWTVVRVWEHDDVAVAAEQIEQLLRRLRRLGARGSAKAAAR
ncbi:very short patch repair endonuclease [Streptomyces sp. NPDC004237]|uniref:very short patch repair endonuclease n=1 Tax=Streptomyces sp. NPDC004237 TaxID=3154455 RepID=UPI0033AE3763